MNTTTETASKRNPWPYAIVAFFFVFIGFIAAFITWGVRQNTDLVSKDYYADEILFQNQIDTENRTRPFSSEVAVNYDSTRRAITIRVPAEHARVRPTGRIYLYRPSDARLDRDISLSTDAGGVQSLDSSRLPPGLWKVRLRWKASGQDFYFHQEIIIDG